MHKFEEHWGWETFEHRFDRDHRLANLQALQRALLRNGFAHLKSLPRPLDAECLRLPLSVRFD